MSDEFEMMTADDHTVVVDKYTLEIHAPADNPAYDTQAQDTVDNLMDQLVDWLGGQLAVRPYTSRLEVHRYYT